MVADMDVDRADWTSLEMQVGERGMLRTALARLRPQWMSSLSRNSTVRAPRFDFEARNSIGSSHWLRFQQRS